jgi:hypothetical protein
VIIQSGAPTNSLFISNKGYVGLGVASPNHPLVVANPAGGKSANAYCTGSSWVSGCSRELKENIEPLTSEQARDAVQRLQPVTYRYKSDPDEDCVGFIAEDVPDLVATRDRKGLCSMDITSVLAKVVQDQDRQLAEEKEKNARQQEMLEALSKRLADLEQKASQGPAPQQTAN